MSNVVININIPEVESKVKPEILNRELIKKLLGRVKMLKGKKALHKTAPSVFETPKILDAENYIK